MSAGDKRFSSVFWDALISVFGVIFTGIFFSSDFRFHFVYGLWCSFIGLIGFLHAPAHYFSQANPRKRICVWITYGCLLVAISIWFSMWSYKIICPLPAESNSADRLVLSVRSKTQFNLIVLTNRSLLFDTEKGISPTNIAGILYLPFPERTPEVELRFGLISTSDREVDLASIGVGMPAYVMSEATNGWKIHTEGDWRGFSFRLEEPVFKDEPINVYPIRFLTFGTNVTRPFPMTVAVRDKQVRPYGVAFGVAIIPMSVETISSGGTPDDFWLSVGSKSIVTNPNPQLVIFRH